MSQNSREPPPQTDLSLRFRSNGRGCALVAWLGIFLSVLGIGLTIAFGMGWL
jgi:hypothetical protein